MCFIVYIIETLPLVQAINGTLGSNRVVKKPLSGIAPVPQQLRRRLLSMQSVIARNILHGPHPSHATPPLESSLQQGDSLDQHAMQLCSSFPCTPSLDTPFMARQGSGTNQNRATRFNCFSPEERCKSQPECHTLPSCATLFL